MGKRFSEPAKTPRIVSDVLIWSQRYLSKCKQCEDSRRENPANGGRVSPSGMALPICFHSSGSFLFVTVSIPMVIIKTDSYTCWDAVRTYLLFLLDSRAWPACETDSSCWLTRHIKGLLNGKHTWWCWQNALLQNKSDIMQQCGFLSWWRHFWGLNKCLNHFSKTNVSNKCTKNTCNSNMVIIKQPIIYDSAQNCLTPMQLAKSLVWFQISEICSTKRLSVEHW